MIEHEVERMIVRLVGDQTSYQRMLKDATHDTGQAAQSIEQTLGGVNKASIASQKMLAANARAKEYVEELGVSYREAMSRSLKEVNAYRGGIQGMTKDVESVAVKQEHHQQILAAGNRITQQTRPAVDQYSEGIAQLNVLLRQGAIDQATFNKSVQNLKLDRLSNLGTQFSQVGSTLAMVGGVATAAFGTITYRAAQAAGQFEMTTVAFSTMMGSQKEALALLEDLTQFAATTPFQMHQVEAAAQGLIQFGDRGEQLMKTLEHIGNAAAATGSDFGHLTYIFNNVRGQGKLLTMQFQQLARRGVVSLQDIADHYKQDLEGAQAMISAGKIGYEDLMGIMERLSSEGGRFAGMMEHESQTLLGLMSTLKDNISITFRDLGQEMLPIIKPVIEITISLTRTLRDVDRFTLKVAAGFLVVGTAGAALVTALGSLAFLGAKLITTYAMVKTTFAGTTLAKKLFSGATAASTASLNVNTAALGKNTAAHVSNQAATARGTATAAAGQVTAGKFAGAVGILAIKIAAIYYATRVIGQAIQGTKQLNQELENLGKTSSRVIEAHAKRQSKLIESVQHMSRGEQEYATRGQRDELQGRIKNLESTINRNQKVAEQLQQGWGTWTRDGYAAIFGLTTETQIVTKETEAYRQELDAAKSQLEEINNLRQREGLGAQAKPEDIDNVKKMVAQWREQVKTMGMSERQLTEYRMIQQRIPDDLRYIAMGDYERLQSARAVRAEYEAQQKAILEQRKAQQEAIRKQQEEYVNLRRSIAGTLAGYQDQINLIGRSANETELYRLARQGANQAELNAANNLMRHRDAATERNKLLERARELMKQNLSPQQQYMAGMKELNTMLRLAGREFYPTYLKEAQKLREELKKNEVTRIVAKFEIIGLDSVRGGTREFLNLQRESANFLLEQKVAKDVDEKSRQAQRALPPEIPVEVPKIEVPEIPPEIHEIGHPPDPSEWDFERDLELTIRPNVRDTSTAQPDDKDEQIPFLERIARASEAQANRPQPQIASIQ